jgi:hypothetical protein
MKTTYKTLIGLASALFLLLATAAVAAENSDVLVSAVSQAQAGPAGDTQKIIENAFAQNFDSNVGPFSVAIMGIIGVFIAPVVLVIIIAWLWYRHSDRTQKIKHETLRLMIEKGVEIPAQFSFMDSPPTPASSLRRGLILTALGLGIACFFLIVRAPEAVGLGAIPFFIGLAYLLIWRLEKNSNRSSDKVG